MRISGKKVEAKEPLTIVLDRATDADPDACIVITAHPLLSYDGFHRVCKEPKPPVKIYPGGRQDADTRHPLYVASQLTYYQRQTEWSVLASLHANQEGGVEFETVDMDDPDTWSNMEKEFADNGIGVNEFNHIFNEVLSYIGASKSSFEAAKGRFFKNRDRDNGRRTATTPSDAPTNTASPEPVNGGE